VEIAHIKWCKKWKYLIKTLLKYCPGTCFHMDQKWHTKVDFTSGRVSDWCLMSTQQFFSYTCTMARTSYFSMRWWWGQLCNRPTRLVVRLFHVTIWICHWRMNTLVTSQYQSRISSITKIFSMRISQSDWNIQIKLNYLNIKTQNNRLFNLLKLNYKEYLKLLNRLYLHNMVWFSLRFS
jgi:hypothetical protein